jgi:hypothetical protein
MVSSMPLLKVSTLLRSPLIDTNMCASILVGYVEVQPIYAPILSKARPVVGNNRNNG